MRAFLIAFLIPLVAVAQTAVSRQGGANTFTSTLNASGATQTAPVRVGSADPGTCSSAIRELFFNTTTNLLKSCNTDNVWTTISGAGSGYATVQEEGSSLTQRATVNFIGSGVTCVDNSGATKTDCTISTGGVTMAAALGDFLTVRTSSTVQTIGSGCSSTTPCKVGVGATPYTTTAAATITLSSTSSGTGTAFIYVTSAGALTVGHNLTDANVTCSGCTKVSGVTSFPTNSFPIATATATNGSGWDSAGVTDQRAFFGIKDVACGAGMQCSESAGVTTVAIGTNTATVGSTPVTFSATPTFTASYSEQLFTITLTGNVTSSTLTMSAVIAGARVTFKICQDGTGSRTFAWPTNVIGEMTIGATASLCSLQNGVYDGTSLYMTSAGITNI